MTVRRLRPDEAALFKTLRLRAVADAPDAFARTFAEISAKPDEWWEEMTRSVTGDRLYERTGFARTGRNDRLPSNPDLAVFEMSRAL